MSFFGVELNAQVNRLILQIKLQLTNNKYLPNFRTIYQAMVKYDCEQSGWVTPQQFEQALNQNGIFFKKYELQVFEKAFLHQGTINWFAFIALLREPLNAVRQKAVDDVWNHLDTSQTGKIHYTHLSQQFNPSDFKEFKLGYKNKDVILKEFLNMVPLTAEGEITYEEFTSFYSDLSINTPSDQTFCQFVTAQWNCPFKASLGVTPQAVKTALKTLRFKLLQRTKSTHEQFILQKLFEQYDVNRNGKLSQVELQAMLVKLQIPVARQLVRPILVKLSQDGSGVVDFPDFKQFLFYDPFHI